MTLGEDIKEELRRVYAQREAVEKQIAVHMEAVPQFEGPVVDAEGFPRADVDIAAVRLHRQQIISKIDCCLSALIFIPIFCIVV